VGIRARGKSWLIADVLQNRRHEIDPEGPQLLEGLSGLKLGAYAFDYVARNAGGGLTLIDFEVSRSRDVLGRMLLHPHAVRRALGRNIALRSVLVVTHLDWPVAELAAKVSTVCPLVVRLAKEVGESYSLVAPYGPDGLGRQSQVSERWRGSEFDRERMRLESLLQR
jgi:hypothetical protein